MDHFNINRRRFLKGATATLALSAIGASALDFINPDKPYRVALIGTGWYGKSDLFRLIQVAPGTLAASTMSYDFIPEGNGTPIHKEVVYEKEKYPEDLTEPAIELNAAPATRLHLLNFLGAIKNGSRPVADIEEGHISTASCILANISLQTGRPVVYDPHKRIITGAPAATALLQRPYRGPWEHPQV